MLEAEAGFPVPACFREDRDQDEPGDSGLDCRLGGLFQALAVDCRGEFGSGAVGARRENHRVVAAHPGRQGRYRVVDQVAGYRDRAGFLDGRGLGRASVHAGGLVAPGGQQPGQGPTHSSGRADLEDFHRSVT